VIHVPRVAEIERAVSRPIDVPRVLSLHPSARARCVEHLEEARAAKVPFIIACAYRSPADQGFEYGKGRKAVGPDPAFWKPMRADGRGIVTHALPWHSWHQYRLAYDVALLAPNGRTVHWSEVADLDDDGRADWLEVVEIAESLELTAGYRWPSRKHDGPHFEFHPGLTIDVARECFTWNTLPDDRFEKVA
jgi:peptidoglycan L-alanyl-D-glutamate endopeptidase CwlK